jgi:hypothetical protein
VRSKSVHRSGSSPSSQKSIIRGLTDTSWNTGSAKILDNGHDSFGNPQFDTKRTELGELVFRLKNRSDKNTLTLLQGALQVDGDVVRDKRILLIDDLYRSGATATVVAQDLLTGGAAAVYMLAMTKTRTRT